jgi:hypothetical protein
MNPADDPKQNVGFLEYNFEKQKNPQDDKKLYH